ncbi:MAG TPA: sugar ABC transporter ATP-binding protein [Lachnospiraceae bacterium]|nr:sugar ABC transporter ATP-binding protein [Lachnospiraceae bacterium]
MNNDVVIKVDNVKKYFKVYPDKGKTLKDKVLFHKRNRFEKREVLKGISFEVKRGEAIGLIGKNGCGKSTTLKLLTRILRPNEGTITIDGRVSSLIELGAGFHPDLTGRENIYINASIFGITAKEVDERLDDIIRFSELEEYIDNPVRTYSSGMYMRLAFSVAINVDADILLIDEILAVGDMNFQEKCFQKLQEIKRNGTTIVIVSHAQGQIEKICDRCIWIEEGVIRDEGPTKLIGKEYRLAMEGMRADRARKEAEEEMAKLRKEEEEAAQREKEEKKRLKKEEEERRLAEEQRKKEERERKIKNLTCREICKQCGPDAHREGSLKAHYTDIQILNENGEPCVEYNTGDKMIVKLKYVCDEENIPLNFVVAFSRYDWVYCYDTKSVFKDGKMTMSRLQGEAELEIECLRLLEGMYYLDVRIFDENNKPYDNVFSIVSIKMLPQIPKKDNGIFSMEHIWKC